LLETVISTDFSEQSRYFFTRAPFSFCFIIIYLNMFYMNVIFLLKRKHHVTYELFLSLLPLLAAARCLPRLRHLFASSLFGFLCFAVVPRGM
jgi:hypothetical protein